MIKILLAEDDINFGSVLKDYLTISGYAVVHCLDGEIALREFGKNEFDLCVLDVMLPLKDGFTLAKEIKQINNTTPFIFLTAKTLKEDIVKGYEIGANDYITKPFDSELLLLKIKALLNRRQLEKPTKATEYNIGKYQYNSDSRTITSNTKKQKLSPKEAALLHLLFENKNHVLTSEYVLKQIWGDSNYFSGRSMNVYITKLRNFLKDDPNIEIENIHGTGYKLNLKGE
ncbi:MAG: response regulator transcription factor [Bacteroidetes bacterium]|nr:response regulator transcription factor [Bacteroidota bacterium]